LSSNAGAEKFKNIKKKNDGKSFHVSGKAAKHIFDSRAHFAAVNKTPQWILKRNSLRWQTNQRHTVTSMKSTSSSDELNRKLKHKKLFPAWES
jgi:hypothetical protein